MVSLGLIACYYYYLWFKQSAVNTEVTRSHFYVPTGTTTLDLFRLLEDSQLLTSTKELKALAELKKMEAPHPGHYLIKQGMSANALINMFKAGLQSPIKLVINPVRKPENLAGKIARYIEMDSLEVLELLTNDSIQAAYGFDSTDFYTLFIPDTYEVYWNVGSETLLNRMNKEYKRFWTSDRIKKAKKIDLKPREVVTLASIVYAEQLQHADERARIAGLYLNRLKKGMALQSDPTLIFAMDDFSTRRVLLKDREIESPYNTYKYAGLPPGPIYLPDKASIDAVLNAEDHNYLYMCAKSDLSGYHNFTNSYSQHLRNAKKYQRAISNQGIYR